MTIKAFVKAGLKLASNRPFPPTHAAVILKDFFKPDGFLSCSNERDVHLKASVEWLCRSQDVNKDGGCAARYSFKHGWQASYPETTGYISKTFFDLYQVTGEKDILERAVRMVDWELTVQMENGAFPGNKADVSPRPVIFNTGQIILGLVSAFKATGEEKYRAAAMRAADWLVSVQDDDGVWRKHTFEGIVHLYNTRVAWSLLEVAAIGDSESHRQAAVRNIDWAVDQQTSNGWLAGNTFTGEDNPVVHIIAYAIRGILESGILLDEQRYIDAAEKAAAKMMHAFEVRKYLPGDFNEHWKSKAKFSCLTGDAQTAIIWFKLYEILGDMRYLNAGFKMNDYLCSLQDIRSANQGICGGIKGSHPIWGRYDTYKYPNWAVKFFVDSLLLESACMKKMRAEQAAGETG